MGYRSEVGIKCDDRAYEMFMQAAKENNIVPDCVYKDDNGNPVEYTMLWNCVKWYDYYSDVKAVESVMQQLDQPHEAGSYDGLGYKFVRIGESYDDIEERTNEYDIELWVTRTLDISGVEIDF